MPEPPLRGDRNFSTDGKSPKFFRFPQGTPKPPRPARALTLGPLSSADGAPAGFARGPAHLLSILQSPTQQIFGNKTPRLRHFLKPNYGSNPKLWRLILFMAIQTTVWICCLNPLIFGKNPSRCWKSSCHHMPRFQSFCGFGHACLVY